MSRSRSSHVSKSQGERHAYNRYISKTDSQPTLDERLDFDTSSELREELGKPNSERERTVPFQNKLKDFFSQHWLEWGLAIMVMIAVYLVYDSRSKIEIVDYKVSDQQQQSDKLDIAIHELNKTVENNNNRYQDQFDKLNTTIQNTNNAMHFQDLSLKEFEFRIKLLEKTPSP
jgi:hypothetical protein